MTTYLTPEQTLFIHYRLIHATGGEPGVRDLTGLVTALNTPASVENGREVYTGLYKKAAVLLDGMLRNKPFQDANKRTAIAAVDLFLRCNGQRLGVDQNELVRFVRKCAHSPSSLEFMTAWFWQYARPLNPEPPAAV
ncbi:MAG: type II toxin-antitoxin system death-on-curing family toxin [Leptolinea sp.]|jgi:death-on-curing protein|nr:type II toxin-antitoxin system death-on-curing family toxin [Leptolinea sp.]